jgi:hypothetical protein
VVAATLSEAVEGFIVCRLRALKLKWDESEDGEALKHEPFHDVSLVDAVRLCLTLTKL